MSIDVHTCIHLFGPIGVLFIGPMAHMNVTVMFSIKDLNGAMYSPIMGKTCFVLAMDYKILATFML